ncbi:hypothetical protein L7F22_046145 [Adiantum nelumboides]|nr:hypothetical protein [Adiantum nelumboides]
MPHVGAHDGLFAIDTCSPIAGSLADTGQMAFAHELGLLLFEVFIFRYAKDLGDIVFAPFSFLPLELKYIIMIMYAVFYVIHLISLGNFFERFLSNSSYTPEAVCYLASEEQPFRTSFLASYVIKGPSFMQRVRAFCFYITTYVVAFPLFFVMLLVQPYVLMFDRHKRKAQHFINKLWASLTISLFYKAEIVGLENLPGQDEAAVYVSNHQSFLDIYTLFLLERPFKFISKTSNFLIPIIGWSMYLTGHVPLRRMDTKSQMECLRHCQKLIKQGVPVFFFPEGTRSRDGKMAQFKRGAFTLAAKAQVPVVPISLIGTGKLMPNGLEGTLRPGAVKVIIHPPLRGSNPDELCKLSRNVISKSLLQHGLEVH